MKYQYQVYNENVNLIVTVPIESKEYASKFGKRVAIDFYHLEEKDLKDVNVEFVCKFMMESVINVNLLKKQKE